MASSKESGVSKSEKQGSDPMALAKRASGIAAVRQSIQLPPAGAWESADFKPLVLGIGSGSTVVPVVDALKNKILKSPGGWNANVRNIVCVPTSWQAKDLIVGAGLPLGDLSQYPDVDIDIDGADEVDSGLNCIKGGGGCHLQEKLVAYNSKMFVLVADWRKESEALGTKWTQGVPIEVVPMAWVPVSRKLKELGAVSVTLRMAVRKAGPVITDNGNLILDTHFGPIRDPRDLEFRLNAVAGVVEVGLFVGLAEIAYFGRADGSVLVRRKGQADEIIQGNDE
ncbi:hypothetical protein M427DRAFT_32623 [Gonapodya prolifera JEL478]|uniref:Ribose-5-phosphate isomerase n=1 Tax=Gonapodya prolifera (strain JEL478) TaxID=1344416 RepID=A0A139AEJ9_GONPJ|nr:hypothetical protein M427DRAFT_32623 [Gonapodya prolifera JEL478]|eukprot:KXS15170.1 hypothetical protein M427DRAFT_32623 [Gonapodya prolifera JEL478]